MHTCSICILVMKVVLVVILCLHIFCLQSIPSNKPGVLEPSLTKQDIGQMVKDVPKYYNTGIFPPNSKDKWDSFLSTFNTVYGTVPSVTPRWIVDDLAPLNRRGIISINPSLPVHAVEKTNNARHIRQVNSLSHAICTCLFECYIIQYDSVLYWGS